MEWLIHIGDYMRGKTLNLNEEEEIEYFRDEFIKMLKIPKDYLYFNWLDKYQDLREREDFEFN